MEGVDEHFRRLARHGAAALSGDGPPSRVSPSGGRRCRSSDGEPSAFETRALPISPCVVNGRLGHEGEGAFRRALPCVVYRV